MGQSWGGVESSRKGYEDRKKKQNSNCEMDGVREKEDCGEGASGEKARESERDREKERGGK